MSGQRPIIFSMEDVDRYLEERFARKEARLDRAIAELRGEVLSDTLPDIPTGMVQPGETHADSSSVHPEFAASSDQVLAGRFAAMQTIELQGVSE